MIYVLITLLLSLPFDHIMGQVTAKNETSQALEKGVLFERGKRGKKGEQGARGHRGKKGAMGATGSAGATGSDGATGPTGPTGATGSTEGTSAFATVHATNSTATAGNPLPFLTTGALQNVTYNGTNTYTIEVTGLYRVSFMLSTATAGRVAVFRDSGGGFTQVAGDAMFPYTENPFENVMLLFAGDQLQVRVISDPVTVSFGSFSVMLLSGCGTPMYGSATAAAVLQSVTPNGTFTFANSGPLNGVGFNFNTTYVIQTTGVYRVSYTLYVQGLGAAATLRAAITRTGVGVIPNTASEASVPAATLRNVVLSYEGNLALNAGDLIRVTATNSTTGMRIPADAPGSSFNIIHVGSL